MTQPAPRSPSSLRRFLAFFDPAEPGFVRRLGRLALVATGAVGCVLCALVAYAAQTPNGRYWTGVVLLEAGRYEQAAQIAAALVEQDPRDHYSYYRLWATALRRGGEIEAQLEVLDTAARVFPDYWRTQGHRCWYHTLFADPAPVMDACDRAVAMAPEDEGYPYGWRAVAKARLGDRAGAIGDLEIAVDRWISSGYGQERPYVQVRRRWLETLKGGGDPFDEATMKRLRGAF